MAYAVSLIPRAEKKIASLRRYLSKRFHPGTADQYIERILDACDSLALAPQRGRRRDDLRPGLRSISFERTATIYYRVVDQQVTIINILYRGQTRASLR